MNKLFATLVVALALTLVLWFRPFRFRGRRWPAVVVGVVLAAVIVGLSWTRLPELEQGFRELVSPPWLIGGRSLEQKAVRGAWRAVGL